MSQHKNIPQNTDYDVIVVGGGPAGSSAAALIAADGKSVLLLDRERFPRPRIGESLMPATYWTLERLGVLDKMRCSGFPEKHSVQFFSGSGSSSVPFYFSEFDSHESSQTWQVDRFEFDQMLVDHARDCGVEVCERANVRDVPFVEGRATGVIADFADGERRELTSRVVVDASGQTSLIARRLKLKTVDPKLRHGSLFTRFRGARRDAGIDEGATLILHTEEARSWFWYIPLPDDVVSVGVVGPIDYLLKRGTGDLQAIFDDEVAICPALAERIAKAEQETPVQALRDFSYISQRIAGHGWVMAGDAFGFLDPIYSSGVFLALRSGEFAADAALAAFRENDFSAASLGRHGAEYVAGMEAMRKLVYAYYDPEFHFPRFLKAHPEYREQMVDLLIGNVFRKPPQGMFEAMARYTDLPESRTLLESVKQAG